LGARQTTARRGPAEQRPALEAVRGKKHRLEGRELGIDTEEEEEEDI
jgi:hypothetical protein